MGGLCSWAELLSSRVPALFKGADKVRLCSESESSELRQLEELEAWST